MKTTLFVAIACWLWAMPGLAPAQRKLEYQERPYAFEGIKSQPVSGFNLELLSAMIESQDQALEFGDRLHVKFYLDRARPAYLVVREIDQRLYYWLDRAKTPWTAGDNTFDWPTLNVLRQLPGLRPADLGVLVRLDREEPGASETVAPASLSRTTGTSAAVTAYVFTFKLREDAKLRGTIFDETKGTPVFSADLGRQLGGRPFSYRWDLTKSSAPAGLYRLVLKGYVLTSNDPVSQVVRFVHAPKEK